jgi:hypothetical protein
LSVARWVEAAKHKFSLVLVVGAAPERDVRFGRLAAQREGVNMMKLQERARAASATAPGHESALGPVSLPNGAHQLGGKVP